MYRRIQETTNQLSLVLLGLIKTFTILQHESVIVHKRHSFADCFSWHRTIDMVGVQPAVVACMPLMSQQSIKVSTPLGVIENETKDNS